MSGRIFLLFFPACLGLLGQTINHAAPDRGWADGQSLLALALLLLAIDQARMAAVDLTQVAAVRVQVQPSDQRLEQFYRITLSTIGLELLGFYGAIGNLGVGAAVVLLSQIWFNLLANIQLQPETEEPIRAWGIADRLPVLVADGVGLILVCLWLAGVAPLFMAGGLLGMVLLYGGLKYRLGLGQVAG
jgi:hypothetical protein